VISLLRNAQPVTELWLPDPPPPTHTGASGPTSASPFPSILSYKTSKTPSTSYKSSSTVSGQVPSHLKSGTRRDKFVVAPLRIPYAQLGKRSLAWGPTTRGSHPRASWISDSALRLARTRRKTLLPTESNQSQ
jgi:hypothetical protein